MSATLTNFPLTRLDGSATELKAFDGKVLLVVNVASKCGLTPQYEGLEKLYREQNAKGFEILGFPSNDFLEQEPGTAEEIATFCKSTYEVSFPLFAKTPVKGENKHPLYAAMIAAKPEREWTNGDGFKERLTGKNLNPAVATDVFWNFEKFLINRKGEVVGRFSPDTAPDSPALLAAIEAELAK